MNRYWKLILLVPTLTFVDRGYGSSGGAFAGGMLAGTVTGLAIGAASRPRSDVVVVKKSRKKAKRLNRELAQLRRENDELIAHNAELEKRLESLEARMAIAPLTVN